MRILNPDLKPWNVYCTHTNPNKSITANVYANNREWYNSFMPPFFLLKDLYLIEKVRNYQINNNCSFDDAVKNTAEGSIYARLSRDYFKESNRISSLAGQYNRINTFLSLESSLSETFDNAKNIYDFSALVLVATNLMQIYMNPLEAFTTGKINAYNNINECFKNKEEQDEQNMQIPMLETIFIPLSVIRANKCKFNSKQNIVFRHVSKLMNCRAHELNDALDRTNQKFEYTKYMDAFTAEEIINIYYQKLMTLSEKDLFLKPAYHLQALNGIMTWSKYIPIRSNPLRFRYFCEIESLQKLLSFPEIANDKILVRECKTISTSGSEKYAKTIFLLSTLFSNSEFFKRKVQSIVSINFNKYLTS